ncbi:hypothetical protein BS47DRAFT_1404557 [Hydnum rufescens UP504]|uniref:Uncharacterized protein n=1 Tax=Hydnum rufescens UP504 TaxID=1448309 RepID=A0A9P6BDU5_9AGAM|nr:hypothetical protein BS47DRAFT_1404557 [Hydnum rufescens UP504]
MPDSFKYWRVQNLPQVVVDFDFRGSVWYTRNEHLHIVTGQLGALFVSIYDNPNPSFLTRGWAKLAVSAIRAGAAQNGGAYWTPENISAMVENGLFEKETQGPLVAVLRSYILIYVQNRPSFSVAATGLKVDIHHEVFFLKSSEKVSSPQQHCGPYACSTDILVTPGQDFLQSLNMVSTSRNRAASEYITSIMWDPLILVT